MGARELLARVYRERCDAYGVVANAAVTRWIEGGALQSFSVPHDIADASDGCLDGVGSKSSTATTRALAPLIDMLALVPVEELSLEGPSLGPADVQMLLSFAKSKPSLRTLLLRRTELSATHFHAVIDALQVNVALTTVLVDEAPDAPLVEIEQLCHINRQLATARGGDFTPHAPLMTAGNAAGVAPAAADASSGLKLTPSEAAAIKAHLARRFDTESQLIDFLTRRSQQHQSSAALVASAHSPPTASFTLLPATRSYPVDLAQVAGRLRDAAGTSFAHMPAAGVPDPFFYFSFQYLRHSVATQEDGDALLRDLSALDRRYKDWRRETASDEAAALAAPSFPVARADGSGITHDQGLKVFLVQITSMMEGANAVWASATSPWLERLASVVLQLCADRPRLVAGRGPGVAPLYMVAPTWLTVAEAKHAARRAFWTACGIHHGVEPRKRTESQAVTSTKDAVTRRCATISDVIASAAAAAAVGGGSGNEATLRVPQTACDLSDADIRNAVEWAAPPSNNTHTALNCSVHVALAQLLALRQGSAVDVHDLIAAFPPGSGDMSLRSLCEGVCTKGFRLKSSDAGDLDRARLRPSMFCCFDAPSNAPSNASPFAAIVAYLQSERLVLGGSAVLTALKFRPQWRAVTDGGVLTHVVDERSGATSLASSKRGFAEALLLVGTRLVNGVTYVVGMETNGRRLLLHETVINEASARYGAFAFVEVQRAAYNRVMQLLRQPSLAEQLAGFPAAIVELHVAAEMVLLQLRSAPALHENHESLRRCAAPQRSAAVAAVIDACLAAEASTGSDPLYGLRIEDVDEGLRIYRAGGGAAIVTWWLARSAAFRRFGAKAAQKIFARNPVQIHPLLDASAVPVVAQTRRSTEVPRRVFFPLPGLTDVLVNGRCDGEAIGLLGGRARASFRRIWDASSASPHGHTPTILVDAGRAFAMVALKVACIATPTEAAQGERCAISSRVEVAFSDDNSSFTVVPAHGTIVVGPAAPTEAQVAHWEFGCWGPHRFWRVRLLMFDAEGRAVEPTRFAPEVLEVQWRHVDAAGRTRIAAAPYGDPSSCDILTIRGADAFIYKAKSGVATDACPALASTQSAIGFLSGLADGCGGPHIDALIRHGDKLFVFFGSSVAVVDAWSGQLRAAPESTASHAIFRHLPEPFRSDLTGAWPIGAPSAATYFLVRGHFFCVYDLANATVIVPPTLFRGGLPGRPAVEMDDAGTISRVQLLQNGTDPYEQFSFPFDAVDLAFSPDAQSAAGPGRFVFVSGDRYVVWMLPPTDQLAATIGSKKGLPDAATQLVSSSRFSALASTSVQVELLLQELRRRRERSAPVLSRPVPSTSLETVEVRSNGTRNAPRRFLTANEIADDSSAESDAVFNFAGDCNCEVVFTFKRPIVADAVEVIADPCGSTWSWEYRESEGAPWVPAACVVQTSLATAAVCNTMVTARCWRLMSHGSVAGRIFRVVPLQSTHKVPLVPIGSAISTIPIALQPSVVLVSELLRGSAVVVPVVADGQNGDNAPAMLVGVELVDLPDGTPSRFSLADLAFSAVSSMGRLEALAFHSDGAARGRCAMSLVREVHVALSPSVENSLAVDAVIALRWLTVATEQHAGIARRQKRQVFAFTTDRPQQSAPVIRCRCACTLHGVDSTSKPTYSAVLADLFGVHRSGDVVRIASALLQADGFLDFVWSPQVFDTQPSEWFIEVNDQRASVGEAHFFALSPSVPVVTALIGYDAAGDLLAICDNPSNSTLLQQRKEMRSAAEAPSIEITLPLLTLTHGVRLRCHVDGIATFRVLGRPLGDVGGGGGWLHLGDATATGNFGVLECLWPAADVQQYRFVQLGNGSADIIAIDFVADPACDAVVSRDDPCSAEARHAVEYAGRVVPIVSLDSVKIPVSIGASLRTTHPRDVLFTAVRISATSAATALASGATLTFSVQCSSDGVTFNPLGFVAISAAEPSVRISWSPDVPRRHWRISCVDIVQDREASTPRNSVATISMSVEWAAALAASAIAAYPVTAEAGAISTNAYPRQDASAAPGAPNRYLHAMLSATTRCDKPALRFWGPFDNSMRDNRSASSAMSSAMPSVMYLAVDLGSRPQPLVRLGACTDEDANHELTVQYSDDGSVFTSVAVHRQRAGWCYSSWLNCGAHRFWRVIVNVATGALLGRRSRRSNSSSHADDDDEAVKDLIQPAAAASFHNLLWFAACPPRDDGSGLGWPGSTAQHQAVVAAAATPCQRVPLADPALLHSYPIGLGVAMRAATFAGRRDAIPDRHDGLTRMAHGKPSGTAIRSASSLEEKFDELLPAITAPELLVDTEGSAFKAIFYPDGDLVIDGAVISSSLNKFTSMPTVCVRGKLSGTALLGAARNSLATFAVEFLSGSTSSTVSYVRPSIALYVLHAAVKSPRDALVAAGFASDASPSVVGLLDVLAAAATGPIDWLAVYSTHRRHFGGMHPPLPHPSEALQTSSPFEIIVEPGVSLLATLPLGQILDTIGAHDVPNIASVLECVLGGGHSLNRALPTDIVINRPAPSSSSSSGGGGAVPSAITIDFVVAPPVPPASSSAAPRNMSVSPLRVTVSFVDGSARLSVVGVATFPRLLGSSVDFQITNNEISTGLTRNDPPLLTIGCAVANGTEVALPHAGARLSHLVGTVTMDTRKQQVVAMVHKATLWIGNDLSAACTISPVRDGIARVRAFFGSISRHHFVAAVRSVVSTISPSFDELLPSDFGLLNVIVDDLMSAAPLSCAAMVLRGQAIWGGRITPVHISLSTRGVLVTIDPKSARNGRSPIAIGGGVQLSQGSFVQLRLPARRAVDAVDAIISGDQPMMSFDGRVDVSDRNSSVVTQVAGTLRANCTSTMTVTYPVLVAPNRSLTVHLACRSVGCGTRICKWQPTEVSETDCYDILVGAVNAALVAHGTTDTIALCAKVVSVQPRRIITSEVTGVRVDFELRGSFSGLPFALSVATGASSLSVVEQLLSMIKMRFEVPVMRQLSLRM